MNVTIASVLAVLLAFLSIPWQVEGCATECEQHQYCNENNNRCQDCRFLCDKDELSCAHKCPDYLLRSLRQQVDILQSDLKTYKIVFLVVISLFVLAILAIVIYKNKSMFESRCLPQGKPSSSSSAGAGPVGYTHENPHTKSPKLAVKNGAGGIARQQQQQQVAPSVALSIYPETEAETSVQTGTTSISHRYPAEDSTESYSYDNAACNVTPTSVAPMPKY
uniref:Protein grindelwald n=1 Tax=Anopheles marajoara TaxID=58244 RepID=A0A2M4BZ85_9DIPT